MTTVQSVVINDLNFWIKCFDNRSFSGQYGTSMRMKGAGSSKKYAGIRGISSSKGGLLKLSMTEDTKRFGNPAFSNRTPQCVISPAVSNR